MAIKSNIIVGLDVGTSAIKVAVGEVSSEGTVNLIGVGVSPSKGLRKGVVINIELTVDAISKAIAQAETMAGTRIQSVFASLSGSHIKGLNSHGIVAIRSKEVSPFDVEKVIEAAKAVAIPLDREILHVLPQEFIIDEQDGIKDPLGISGVRLEARVHIVTGAVASAQNIVKCANRCGLAVRDVVFSALASGRGVLAPEEQELGVCVVDIGGGTSDLAVFHGGAIKYTSVVPVGGNHITTDIAAGLHTPVAAAEDIKCRYGSALGESENTREMSIEVPSTGDRASRTISRRALSEIIEARVQEIFSLVQRDIARAGVGDLIGSGYVLTGGAAGLKGMQRLAESSFRLPVRIGTPRGVTGLTDLVAGSEYGTAVGLVVHGAVSQATYRASGKGGPLSRGLRRVGSWFAEHF
jgi:cell division protein FtsA